MPEILLAGKERECLNLFYTNSARNKTSFTETEKDKLVRAYPAPGALSTSLEVYRVIATSAAQNLASARTKLPMPVLALGGEFSLGPRMVAMAEVVADDVRGGSIPDCGHWVNEENPAYLLAQLLAF